MADLHINQKIDIVVDNGPYKGTYLSKVAEIINGIYKVTAPFTKGEIVPIRISELVKVSFNDDNASYQFTARVVERQRNPVALFSLKKIGQVIRIQRRNFFRLDAKLDVKYRILDVGDIDEEGKLEETTTIDISAGGIKISINEELPKEKIMELYLNIPGLENTAIFGKVVNKYNLPDGKAVGIEFMDIEHGDQDKIVSWIFDFQRELRKRGLL